MDDNSEIGQHYIYSFKLDPDKADKNSDGKYIIYYRDDPRAISSTNFEFASIDKMWFKDVSDAVRRTKGILNVKGSFKDLEFK